MTIPAGTARVPLKCICGHDWSRGDLLCTDDEAAEGGWEEWRYCDRCDESLFFPYLASQQEPLGKEFEKVLSDNLWDLYEI